MIGTRREATRRETLTDSSTPFNRSSRPKRSPSCLAPRASCLPAMKTIKISTALKRLHRLNDEIRYHDFFNGGAFSSGGIAFRSRRGADPKQINHDDKDVI